MMEEEMTEATSIKRRIEAVVMTAQINAKAHDGDNAIAAADLLCAFVLISVRCGADPEVALAAMWDAAKDVVANFWSDQTIN